MQMYVHETHFSTHLRHKQSDPCYTTTVTKMPLFGSHSQVYYNHFYNTLSADFQIRALLFTEVLSWSLTKLQIMTLFYLARPFSSLTNIRFKLLGSRPAIDHPFDKTLLVLADFSRGTLMHKSDK